MAVPAEAEYHYFTLRSSTRKRLAEIRISKVSGGWQGLVQFLQEKDEKRKGKFILNCQEYQRLARYAKGKGGYESLFKMILADEVE